jgi:hypothetical protein
LPKYIEEPPTEEIAQIVCAHLDRHLKKPGQLFSKGIANATLFETGHTIEPAEVEMRIEKRRTSGYRVWTNLESKHFIDPEPARVATGRGILAVAGIYNRLQEMERHNALSGCSERDLPLLDTCLAFLEGALLKDRSVDQFRRVITIGELTTISEDSQIDAAQLIKVASSTECLEFRKWIREVSSMSDEELRERLRSLKSQVGTFATGVGGRTLRFLASTGVGMVPVLGPALGAVVGALDTFVVDKLVAPPGPVVFLNRLYPSILK